MGELTYLMSQGSRDDLEEIARVALEIKNRQWQDDPYLWACECVKTQDEATQQLLRFPRDLEYVRDMFEILQTESMIVFPKSRRMFVTWAVATWALHRIRFHRYNAVFWQSLQESKAAYVVDERMKFIEDNLDPMVKKEYLAIKTKTGAVGKLQYKDTGSFVLAIPQGDDQIRSFTPSVLICDEIEHQPEGPAAIKAALSTVEKNAKIVLIGTSDGPGRPIAEICGGVNFTSFPKYYGASMISLVEGKDDSKTD